MTASGGDDHLGTDWSPIEEEGSVGGRLADATVAAELAELCFRLYGVPSLRTGMAWNPMAFSPGTKRTMWSRRRDPELLTRDFEKTW